MLQGPIVNHHSSLFKSIAMQKVWFPLLAFLLLLGACNPQKRLAKQKSTYMKKTYMELRGALNEAEVSMLNDTVKVLFPEHLLFALNSSEITPEVRPLMNRFAAALNKFDKTHMLINGYTDNTGAKAYNLQISKERSEATRQLLESDGVAPSRMLTWGLGMATPIADNSTEEGRRRNRRVEFIILYTIAEKAK